MAYVYSRCIWAQCEVAQCRQMWAFICFSCVSTLTQEERMEETLANQRMLPFNPSPSFWSKLALNSDLCAKRGKKVTKNTCETQEQSTLSFWKGQTFPRYFFSWNQNINDVVFTSPSSVSFSSTHMGSCVSLRLCVKAFNGTASLRSSVTAKYLFFSSDLNLDKGSVIIYIYSKVSLLSQFNSAVLKGQLNQKLNDCASYY